MLLLLINFPPVAAVWRGACHLPYISRWQAANVVYRVDARSQLIANEAVAGKRLAEWAYVWVCATIRLEHRIPPRTQRGTRSDRWWNKDVNPGVATGKLIMKERPVFFFFFFYIYLFYQKQTSCVMGRWAVGRQTLSVWLHDITQAAGFLSCCCTSVISHPHVLFSFFPSYSKK